MSIGPLMLDIEGLEVNSRERDLLQNPLLGGMILFSRNYDSPQQVAELTQSIREIAGRDILIAVDHEGGRVQRFREGFTAVPAMGTILLENSDHEQAKRKAYHWGAMIAIEVQAVGIDFSFAPVLDLNKNISQVIGDRAFSGKVDEVIELGREFIRGMNDYGMAATAKHFPGHGSVEADSHIDIPVDDRPREQIISDDMRVFAELAKNYQAVMPAHVIYPAFDKQPAGFSNIWLQDILRGQLGFDGVIFSDDLSMKGAEVVGGYYQRAEAAIKAGCDMVLVCNHPKEGQELAEQFDFDCDPKSTERLAAMRGKALNYSLSKVQGSDQWLSLKDNLLA
ncbi:beta-N-acetylhexosaminidase [Kangiella profundi]|uniref:Beta-hexosaminidase n=1 Tax=Kangiella profundi TaxID=1561924 RepID=A0A2K9AIZ7_9GAMM|nr:beta-N-acetylhexosaminidase [Kangiella profundi]AUD78904.1 beta-N-acetylhexosaminidase [Kangiella profundi]GGF03116.1 beta-hexosaminidase [Kangiella profundi]